MAINSNCDQSGGCGAGPPQETWLRSDLAAHPTVHPRVLAPRALQLRPRRRQHACRRHVERLFDAGAEIVLTATATTTSASRPRTTSGHLDNAAGIRQFVVGTGGAFFTASGTRPTRRKPHQTPPSGC